VGDAEGITGGVVPPPPDEPPQAARAAAVSAKLHDNKREIFNVFLFLLRSFARGHLNVLGASFKLRIFLTDNARLNNSGQ
jgi:hypothetical protein